ncbi:MAG: YkgJ family cysteine cluster protein [Bradymonadales bacterium]|nr:YkgJ family cysteine cluster protein [Bradymonadales bacterium]
MPHRKDLDQALTELDRLYGEVDRLAARLVEFHGARLLCRRGCHACCADELTVFEVEAESIRQHTASLLETELPHPTGHCAFLDGEGACRIYSHRPYVCRTQGLPLRWFQESDTGALVEYRDICPLNDGAPPLEELPESACWLIGPFEARLAGLQRLLDGGALRRLPLRSLFAGRPR